MQSVAIRNSFDCANRRAFRLQHGNKTTVHQHSVYFDGASAALSFPAAFFCPGQPGLLSKHVEQPRHGIRLELHRPTIHMAFHANLAR
jgi:hypothetical protein